MPPNDPGPLALGHIDKARAERPKKDGHELSAALRCLSEYRDRVTAAYRAAPGALTRLRMEHVNAVISSVMAAQFPLGEVPWEELDRARGWLAALIDEDAANPLPA